MRGRRAGIVLLLAAAFAAGCGSGSDSGLSTGQRQGLLAQLEAARASAATKDVAGTEAAVRKFRVSVARLERSGALTATAARTLRLGAVRLLAKVKRDAAPAPAPAPQPAPTQTATTPAPAPTPQPQPPGKKKEKKKEHGKGHKKGEQD